MQHTGSISLRFTLKFHTEGPCKSHTGAFESHTPPASVLQRTGRSHSPTVHTDWKFFFVFGEYLIESKNVIYFSKLANETQMNLIKNALDRLVWLPRWF